jgi:hypothetical protein
VALEECDLRRDAKPFSQRVEVHFVTSAKFVTTDDVSLPSGNLVQVEDGISPARKDLAS